MCDSRTSASQTCDPGLINNGEMLLSAFTSVL